MTNISKKDLEKWLRDNPDLGLETGLSGIIPKKEEKPHKYRARRTTVDGLSFDSEREAHYYHSLKLFQEKGHIHSLELQPKFVLQEKFTDAYGNKHRAITYKADFKFYDIDLERWVVVDVKGYETAHFKDKKKIFLKLYSDQYLYEIWR